MNIQVNHDTFVSENTDKKPFPSSRSPAIEGPYTVFLASILDCAGQLGQALLQSDQQEKGNYQGKP